MPRTPGEHYLNVLNPNQIEASNDTDNIFLVNESTLKFHFIKDIYRVRHAHTFNIYSTQLYTNIK